MSESTSLKLFKCPSCGAPLDPTPGMAAMKCPYCGATVIIPETIRASTQNPKPSENLGTLSDVTRLAKEGKLDEAAKIYSRITGLSHENAMFSVKSMAGIYGDTSQESSPAASKGPSFPSGPSFSTGPVINSQPQIDSRPGEPYVISSAPSMPIPRRRNRSCLSGIINLVIFIVVISSVFPSVFKSLPFTLPTEFPFEIPFLTDGSLIPKPFASELSSFSTRGLNDPRSIGVDGNGNIVVASFSGGEIKVYDSTGNQISDFTTEADTSLTSIAVSRDGVIYVPSNTILMYNMDGEQIGSIGPNISFGYRNIALGPNNAIYAVTLDAIIRFNKNGEIDLTIPAETIEELTGDLSSLSQVTVDAFGNIYYWGTFDATVYKFSPDGEFLNTFGGEESPGADFQPGKFVSPHQIIFDNYGRIYVVDFFNIQVLDADGNYIDKIEPGHYGAAFDAQNNLYAIKTLGHDVVKYQVKAPGE